MSAMNAERDAARFIYEGSRMIEVVPTCGKQGLPFNFGPSGPKAAVYALFWVRGPDFSPENAAASRTKSPPKSAQRHVCCISNRQQRSCVNDHHSPS